MYTPLVGGCTLINTGADALAPAGPLLLTPARMSSSARAYMSRTGPEGPCSQTRIGTDPDNHNLMHGLGELRPIASFERPIAHPVAAEVFNCEEPQV